MFQIVARINTVDGIITPLAREDFGRYRKYISTCQCDICGTKRERRDLVVVRHEDGSEQVAGMNCLEKLYGVLAVRRAESAAYEEERDMTVNWAHTDYLVNCAVDLQLEVGFTSKRDAERFGVKSNADLLREGYCAFAKSNMFEEIKSWLMSLEPNSDFIANAQSLLSKAWTSDRAFDFVPAVVNSYFKHLEQQKIAKALEAETKFFGAVGDKFRGRMKVTLIHVEERIGESYSYYDDGVKFLSYLKTENNEVLQWDSKNTFPVKEGETFELEYFSVKSQFVSKRFGKVTKILRPRVAK